MSIDGIIINATATADAATISRPATRIQTGEQMFVCV